MGRLKYFFIFIILISPCFATFAEDTSASACTSSGFDWINNSHYNATESFDYPNGTINPTGFMLWGSADPGYGYVVDEVDGHAKVYEFWDNDADPDNEKYLSATANFNQAKGNWSFWFRMADPGNAFGIAELLSNGAAGASPVLAFGTASLGAIIITSDIACAEGAGAGMTLVGTVIANQWHYINVEFDNTSSTFEVTFDDNSPVTCNLYGDWGTLGATNQLFGTGAVISSASSNHYLWIDAVNKDWNTLNANNTVPSCCGDDSVYDTFYNGTLNTGSFCYNAEYYINGLDDSENLCTIYGYDWFYGTTTGTNASCCGDDGAYDNFYNNSISTTNSFCYQGYATFHPLDFNQTLCEDYSYTWFNNSNYPATYSFTYDNNGEGIASGWVLYGTDYGTNEVVEQMDGHEKVYHMLHTSATNGDFGVSVTTQNQASGTFDFWMKNMPGGSGENRLWVSGSGGGNLRLYWSSSQLFYYDGVVKTLESKNQKDGLWHYYKVIYDCASSWSVYKDNVLIGSNLGFYGTCTDLDNWNFISYYQDSDFYLDALDFSWNSGRSGDLIAACCGDDGAFDTFFNSSGACFNGSIIYCGLIDGVCLEDYGMYCETPDIDCSSYPENTYSLCVNASTTWSWIPNYNTGESPYCCGNNGTSDDWLGQSSCCYNGFAMSSGNISNSLYCSSGQLFDCNDQVSDAGGVDTNVATGIVKGAYYCLSNNTWARSYYTPSEVSVELPPGLLVSGNTYSGTINFTINNPLNEFQTYNLVLNYDNGYARFTVSESNTLTVTVPPLSDFVTYIDVYPVISGEISFTLTMNNVNNPEDYLVEQFSVVVVPTEEDSKGIYYFDEVSLFELLVNFINQIIVLIT
ncbi:MAG: hypothetical protein JW791_02575 [Nanoarchaeota archaeon]|nr:hypothetical protein [Nanoarchaeota archaeon]